MGETRDERLAEFLEENDSEVVCLREGAWLDVDGSQVVVGGEHGGKLFKRGHEPRRLQAGDRAVDATTWLAG